LPPLDVHSIELSRTVMKDQQIEALLEGLEKEHQNELDMVYQFELDYFSTPYLEEIHHKFIARCQFLRQIHRRMLIIGILSPIWLIIGIIGLFVLENTFVSMLILLFPLFMTVCIGGLLWLFVRYGGIKRQEDTVEIIRDEIRRRRRQLFC